MNSLLPRKSQCSAGPTSTALGSLWITYPAWHLLFLRGYKRLQMCACKSQMKPHRVNVAKQPRWSCLWDEIWMSHERPLNGLPCGVKIMSSHRHLIFYLKDDEHIDSCQDQSGDKHLCFHGYIEWLVSHGQGTTWLSNRKACTLIRIGALEDKRKRLIREMDWRHKSIQWQKLLQNPKLSHDHIHWTILNKIINATHLFCPHFSWAELKDLRLFLCTQKAYFSKKKSQIWKCCIYNFVQCINTIKNQMTVVWQNDSTF